MKNYYYLPCYCTNNKYVSRIYKRINSRNSVILYYKLFKIMEQDLRKRFHQSVVDVTRLISKFADENEATIKELKKADKDFPEYRKDSVYSVVKPGNVSLTIHLLKCDNLIHNLSQIIGSLILPFTLKINVGYSCLTVEGDTKVFIPTRYTALKLKQNIMRQLDDVDEFLKELGWTYQATPDSYSNDELVKQIIATHDERLGWFSNSNFSMGSIYYLVLYIQCNSTLLSEWAGIQ